ncbi:D-alanine-D-alanine ligase [Entomortierella parvispora]|uniref:D-alanine-D-alanine ligase n=1 Tax=Entomortierella parvispora TaxID=205924 RepID=A0A9P3HC87_9FUNG|nr:D-alanine-D-alanine ligase [Entomortierella parvispora]
MPTSTPLAAVRILRPTQSHRRLTATDRSGGEVPLDQDPTDPITLANEFDRANAVVELQGMLHKGGFIDAEVVLVSLDTLVQVADDLEEEMKQKMALGQDLVVFQLCDGTELDGYPGVSMVIELEKRKIPFTGSDSAFYIISSSKPILKKELQAAHVPTSSFKEFRELAKREDLDDIIQEIGFPMIVKPSISYASINITVASVVHDAEHLLEQVNLSLAASLKGTKKEDSADAIADAAEILKQKQQHYQETQPQDQQQAILKAKTLKKDEKMALDIETPTVFVEQYLAGLEFTALVIGDKDWGIRVYPVAERAFDPNLGKFERLLSFDQYWDGYDLNGGQGNEDFCRYQLANPEWQERLQQVARDAYLALDGNGYGRVDIRTMEMDKCEPVVLEVNCNCGLSFEKDSSSLANILLLTHVDPPAFIHELIDHALHRNRRLYGTHHTHHHQAHRPTTVLSTHGHGNRERVEVLVQS